MAKYVHIPEKLFRIDKSTCSQCDFSRFIYTFAYIIYNI